MDGGFEEYDAWFGVSGVAGDSTFGFDADFDG